MISSAPSTAQQACITATATHGTGWPAMIWSVTSAGRLPANEYMQLYSELLYGKQ